MISLDFDETVRRPPNCPKSQNVDFRHVPTVPNRTKRHDAFLTMKQSLGYVGRFAPKLPKYLVFAIFGTDSCFWYVLQKHLDSGGSFVISLCLKRQHRHCVLRCPDFAMSGTEALSCHIVSRCLRYLWNGGAVISYNFVLCCSRALIFSRQFCDFPTCCRACGESMELARRANVFSQHVYKIDSFSKKTQMPHFYCNTSPGSVRRGVPQLPKHYVFGSFGRAPCLWHISKPVDFAESSVMQLCERRTHCHIL